MVDAKPYGDVGGAPRRNEDGGTDVGVDGVDKDGLLGAGMKCGLGFGTDWLLMGNNGNVV